MDIETQRSHDQKCFDVSKSHDLIATTRSISHPGKRRSCNDIIEECRKKNFDGASQWSLEDWISKLAKGGGAKKGFLTLLESKLFQ